MCALETLQLDRNKINKLNDGAFYGPIALNSLILDYNYIEAVSRGWLFELLSLRVLSASHNNMSRIDRDGWDFCKELSHLDLSYNRLHLLESHGFSLLGKLQTLKISNNMITVLEDFAFNGLGQLTSLDLSYNEISSSIEDINGAFLGLDSLDTLSLRHNRIRTLSSSALEGLENVATLDLCENEVTSIQNKTFKNMKNLGTLSIVSSSFLCDCQLAWFPTWLNAMNNTRQGFMYTVEGTCFHPPDLKGRDILTIEESEFVCVDHPIPVLLQEPKGRTALIGDNITLECSASAAYTDVENATLAISSTTTTESPPSMESDNPLPNSRSRGGGFPLKADGTGEEGTEKKRTTTQRRDAGKKFNYDKHGMAITWKREQEIIKASTKIEIRNQTQQQGAYVYVTSILVLHGVSAKDTGKYNCIVSNNYGYARSTPAQLTVNEYPKFTKTPVNVTIVKNGSSALLDCAATGQPSPLITWQKDGGKAFPAATQRRLLREQKNLRKLSDDEENEDDNLEGGGGMLLKPGLSDEAEKDSKDEKFAVDADAPLKFGIVLPEDAGEYECVAQSSVGRIVAKAMLIVEIEPTFTRPIPPVSKAVVGGDAVLRCIVGGNPKPEIIWQFNGRELNITSRHYLAVERQLLVIIDAQMSDAGKYICIAENKQGIIEGETDLQITENPSNDNLWNKLFNGSVPTGIVLLIVFGCIIITSLIWLVILCYSRREQEKALSTNTDDTGLDAHSYASTDESIRKCQSSHSIHLISEDNRGPAPNTQYEMVRYQSSASTSNIPDMQITLCRSRGSQRTGYPPMISPTSPLHPAFRQPPPRRSLSSSAIKREQIILPRFKSTENFRIVDDVNPVFSRRPESQHKIGGAKAQLKSPLTSPSAYFARKAAGDENYVPVVLKTQSQQKASQPTTLGGSQEPLKTKRTRVKGQKQRQQSKEQKHKKSIQPRSRVPNGTCNNAGTRGSGRGISPHNNKGRIGNDHLPLHNEQNTRQSDKKNNFGKTRNHDSAKIKNADSWQGHRDRRKINLDSTSSVELLPLDGATSRHLRSPSDNNQPKISSSSGSSNPADFSTTSESSALLHHNNHLMQHNCPTPPSGQENSRLLTTIPV
uniref:leucine-rich repeats and immunoglobulin-like domains protein 3 n=1 Tax=Styela clava TaxID=7725 RepID=UPI00193A85C3|nr:leucine-rich repeats and immunoglobulin-like domains protein 3 [Styela clava]